MTLGGFLAAAAMYLTEEEEDTMEFTVYLDDNGVPLGWRCDELDIEGEVYFENGTYILEDDNVYIELDHVYDADVWGIVNGSQTMVHVRFA